MPPAYINERGVISWDPYRGELPERLLEGCDTVINLCGVGLADKKWTADYRRQITDSRLVPTELIAKKIAGMESPPRQLFNASAVGLYGLRKTGDLLTESSPPGGGFLAEMCQRWEDATSIAEWAEIRVVHMRFGPVLAPGGGMLKRLLPVFSAGLGGRLGHGQQPLSWVAMPDVVRAIDFLLSDSLVDKAVNITSPNPVTNVEFTQKLAAALNKPARLAVPALVLKLMYGQMADEALLNGQAAVPKRLMDEGFKFQYPDLDGALAYALGAEHELQ